MSRFSIRGDGAYAGGSVMAGQNTDPMGNRAPNDYHPTVTMLLLLVLAEFAFVLLLRFAFRHTHGG